MTHFQYIGKIGKDGAAQLANAMHAAVYRGEKELYLGIMSPGGHTETGFALHNLVQSLGVNVTTYALGHVDSAAVPMFLAGSKRLVSPLSSVMIHKPVQNLPPASEYTATFLQFLATELSYHEKRIKEILADRTKLGETQISSFLETGKRFLPSEAVEYGLAHEIRLFAVPPGIETIVVGE